MNNGRRYVFKIEYTAKDVEELINEFIKYFRAMERALESIIEDGANTFYDVYRNAYAYVQVGAFINGIWMAFHNKDYDNHELIYAFAIRDIVRIEMESWRSMVRRKERRLHLPENIYKSINPFWILFGFSTIPETDERLRKALLSLHQLLIKGWEWVENEELMPPNIEIWRLVLYILVNGNRRLYRKLSDYIEKLVRDPVFYLNGYERAKWFLVYEEFGHNLFCLQMEAFGGSCSNTKEEGNKDNEGA
jgi:hypothetical protein